MCDSYLDVLHVLEEIRLGVVVVGELNQVPELLPGGEVLHQAGEDRGVLVLHALNTRFPHTASALALGSVHLSTKTTTNLRLAAETFVDGVQDGVLDHVLVDLLSDPACRHLTDHRGQTQGGVVCQRHVADLDSKTKRDEFRRQLWLQKPLGDGRTSNVWKQLYMRVLM